MKKILMIAANPRAKSLARPVQVRALVRLKEVFHTTVLEAAGNSLLREMAEQAQRIPLASLCVLRHPL
jgi:DNA-binding GntR family transcriptional regulator